MTITQTVEIPADRRVRFDIEVPREIPEGKAKVELKVVPYDNEEGKPVSSTNRAISSEGSPLEPPLKCLIGIDVSLVDSLVGIISNPENKTDKELLTEALMEKYG